MKLLLIGLICVVAFGVFGCTSPNKFCQFEAFGVKKCVQLDDQLTEQRCKDIGGTPAKDCGK